MLGIASGKIEENSHCNHDWLVEIWGFAGREDPTFWWHRPSSIGYEQVRLTEGSISTVSSSRTPFKIPRDLIQGMTGFGTARRETTKMLDSKHPEYDHEKPDQSEIPLQSGTNKFASQKVSLGYRFSFSEFNIRIYAKYGLFREWLALELLVVRRPGSSTLRIPSTIRRAVSTQPRFPPRWDPTNTRPRREWLDSDSQDGRSKEKSYFYTFLTHFHSYLRIVILSLCVNYPDIFSMLLNYSILTSSIYNLIYNLLVLLYFLSSFFTYHLQFSDFLSCHVIFIFIPIQVFSTFTYFSLCFCVFILIL